MKKYLLIIVVALFSCASSNNNLFIDKLYYGEIKLGSLPRKWCFAENFPQALRSSVRNGFNSWNKSTNINMFVEVDTREFSSQNTTIVTYSNRRKGNRWAETGFRYYHGNITSSNVEFYSLIYEATLQTVETIAAHEAGHSLGLNNHIPNSDCVMYKNTSKDGGLKHQCSEEIRQVVNVYGRKD